MTTLDVRKPAVRPIVSRGAAITTAVAGLVLLVASFAPQPADGPPLATATATEIRAWAQAQAAALRTGALAGLAAVALVLIITAALTRVIRDALPHSLLAEVFAGAGYLLVASLFLDAAVSAMPAALPDLIGTDLAKVDDDVLRGWYGLNGATHLLGDFRMAFIALLIGAFSLVVLRSRVVPRWIGWLGAAVTVSAVLGTVGVAVNSGVLYGFWFGGVFGWLLWYPIVGIALALRARASKRTD